MSNITINLKIVRVKSGQNEIRLPCPYCNHILKNFDSLRKHLSRNHSTELGIDQVKKQASKLWRLYREAEK